MSGGQVTVPLVIRTQGGAGRSLGAQHSQSLEAWFAHVPGLITVMPSTPYDAKGLLKNSIRQDNPVLFIEHKMLYMTKGNVPKEDYTIPFCSADVKRQGKDVTLVATSRMVQFALEAAQDLSKKNIDLEIIDPRTLSPIDETTILNSIKKTNRLVIAHEAVKRCGWGAELAAIASEKALGYLDAPIVRVAAKNSPIGFSPKFEEYLLPGKQSIIDAVEKIMN
jgi:pyruvate dehydrogenase E1 component beta subunit